MTETPAEKPRNDVYVRVQNILRAGLRTEEITDDVALDWEPLPDGTERLAGVEVLAARGVEVDGLAVVTGRAHGTAPDTEQAPDRLTWIDTAARTAAAERHVRYQETACALRPDAVTGFVERLAMEWEQRAADVKPAIHATEQDVYGECAARLRGLLAQRDLAAGSWQPFTRATTTVPTARLTEWAGLLRQLSVHVPLEDPALTRTLEAAQLMQWWAGQEVVRDTATETNRTTSEETPNA